MTIIICSGGFDPIHSGHIAYLKAAKALGDYLVVGPNSDEWLKRKKGGVFLPYEERKTILEAIQYVDLVLPFDDSDGSARDLIFKVQNMYLGALLIFANGGDRVIDNIPELDLLNTVMELDFAFGVGGTEKLNSSSNILNNWKENETKQNKILSSSDYCSPSSDCS